MKLDENELPHVIVGSCMEVHHALGPGLPGEAYRDALAREFRMRELVFKRDYRIPVVYKGETLGSEVRVDFLVEDLILVTARAVEALKPMDKERMNSCLRHAKVETGLLVNFNVRDLRRGIKRLIVSSETPAVRYR